MIKYICFVIALISSLLFVNIVISDLINARVNPYQKNEKDMKEDDIKNRVKIVLITIASLFWGAIYIL